MITSNHHPDPHKEHNEDSSQLSQIQTLLSRLENYIAAVDNLATGAPQITIRQHKPVQEETPRQPKEQASQSIQSAQLSLFHQ